MSRLPTPNGDDGTWGGILNDYLSQVHNTDGSLKSGAVDEPALSSAVRAKLNATGSDPNAVHITGNETVLGAKDFTGGLTVNGTNVVVGSDTRLADARLPIDASVTSTKLSAGNGSDNQVLALDSTVGGGLKWVTPSTGGSGVSPSAVTLAPAPSGGDDLAALNSAMPSAGILMLRNGTYNLSGMLTIPDGVDLRGTGGSMYAPGSRLTCTTASAGVTLADSGGVTADFLVDGNNTALTPLVRTGGAQRTVFGVGVIDAAQDNITILASQNDLWLCVNTQYAARDNLVMDQGAGGILFDKCEFNGAARYGLRSDDTVSGGPYDMPTHNSFYHCLFERHNPFVSNTVSQVYLKSGDIIKFQSCVLYGGSNNTGPIMDVMTPGLVVFDSGRIIGDGPSSGTTGIRVVNGVSLTLAGTPNFLGLQNGIELASGNPHVSIIGEVSWTSVGARYSGSGSPDISIGMQVNNPVRVFRDNSVDTAFAAYLTGESGVRFQVYANGAIGFNDGVGYTPKAYLYQGGAGILAMPASQVLKTGQGNTGARPAASTAGVGAQWYDTTLSKPIWSDGTNWRDASGATV